MIRNVGLFAHVDAGKTTTTEQILFASGKIRTAGSVDAGTAQTDWLDVERDRGISVRAAVTRYPWQGVSVNIVDTPGHVDFLSEVERCLRVMDGAVLIVSAAEGVQAQTEVIWGALRQLHIPTLIYVNKMDRTGADPAAVLGQIRRLLSPAALPVQAPAGREETFRGAVDLLAADGCIQEMQEEGRAFRKLLHEGLAEREETLLLQYLEQGELTPGELLTALKPAVRRSECFPVLFGASGRGIGILPLMDAMVSLLPPPEGSDLAPVSGVVFKLEQDAAMGRVAYIRLYDGVIRNRDSIWNETRQLEEKVTQIRKVEGPRTVDAGVLRAGDMAAVYGLSHASVGDVIGMPDRVPRLLERLAVPLLTVQVHWRNEGEFPAVVSAFRALADEDPHLDVQWLKEERELHLKVMGPIQIEVLSELVKSRYGLEVTFGEPTVIYKETPAQAGEGFIAYTMPKPCWAVLRFKIEPGERGSGLQYASTVRKEELLESYQNEVARRVPEALQQGLSGWEVTDLKVTLVQGEHHVWHTHPLDFVVATPMGIMDGLARTGTKLLEPVLRFRLSVPEETGGKIMHELVLMRAEFEPPVLTGERLELTGMLPVATSLDFPARLSSMTKGRGHLSVTFGGYRECPPEVRAERTRRGVNPLEQSKYILAVRNAL